MEGHIRRLAVHACLHKSLLDLIWPQKGVPFWDLLVSRTELGPHLQYERDVWGLVDEQGEHDWVITRDEVRQLLVFFCSRYFRSVTSSSYKLILLS